MRFLSVFFMLLVLGLSLVPCCLPSDMAGKGEMSAKTGCCADESCKDEQQQSQQEDKTCGACSPFFSCGTCTGFTFQHHLIRLSNPVIVLERLYPEYSSKLYPEYFNKKWQPPKIS